MYVRVFNRILMKYFLGFRVQDSRTGFHYLGA